MGDARRLYAVHSRPFVLHLRTQADAKPPYYVRGNVVPVAKLCSDFNDMHVSGFIPTGPPFYRMFLSI